MSKIKVSEATSQQLNWLVAKCEGVAITKFKESPSLFFGGGFDKYAPSTNWEQGGPILDKERIGTTPFTITVGPDKGTKEWFANYESFVDVTPNYYSGPTKLIAGMRCYVAAKLGEEVEVPDELV